MQSTSACCDNIVRLKQELDTADAVVIGAGSGLSTSAGFLYTGERFQRYFGDFIAKYGFRDMYSGGFYPFDSLEEHWASSAASVPQSSDTLRRIRYFSSSDKILSGPSLYAHFKMP